MGSRRFPHRRIYHLFPALLAVGGPGCWEQLWGIFFRFHDDPAIALLQDMRGVRRQYARDLHQRCGKKCNALATVERCAEGLHQPLHLLLIHDERSWLWRICLPRILQSRDGTRQRAVNSGPLECRRLAQPGSLPGEFLYLCGRMFWQKRIGAERQIVDSPLIRARHQDSRGNEQVEVLQGGVVTPRPPILVFVQAEFQDVGDADPCDISDLGVGKQRELVNAGKTEQVCEKYTAPLFDTSIPGGGKDLGDHPENRGMHSPEDGADKTRSLALFFEKAFLLDMLLWLQYSCLHSVPPPYAFS